MLAIEMWGGNLHADDISQDRHHAQCLGTCCFSPVESHNQDQLCEHKAWRQHSALQGS